MTYATDRKNPPEKRPELYRPAQFPDITNVNVRGFYTLYGTYWRKNGMSKTWKRNKNRACVPVKFGIYAHGRIDENNFHNLFVRLDEVTTWEGKNSEQRSN